MYSDGIHLTPPPLQLATYQDHQRGLKMAFHYAGQSRLPRAVTIQSAQGQAVYCLGFDQAGSLKAVASQDPDGALRVVKVMDYDSFGNVLSDSNPGLFLPLSFAGGLRDRFTGLVRFCHRDYDPTVGRFTAPDPLGDTGGDHDLYDYCVDEPVGAFDPEGLKEGAVAEEGGFFDGLKNMFGKLGDKIGGLFSTGEAEPEAAGPAATASQAEGTGQAKGTGQTDGNSTASPQSNGASSQTNATSQSGEAHKYATFDRGKGTLEVHDGQGVNTWNATSGPFGKGALPEGNYTIGGNIPKNTDDTSFCDKEGNCFSVVIDQNFTTERNLLRIHPNKSGRGTEGCIGVKDSNTKPLFNSLKGMRGRQVEVR